MNSTFCYLCQHWVLLIFVILAIFLLVVLFLPFMLVYDLSGIFFLMFWIQCDEAINTFIFPQAFLIYQAPFIQKTQFIVFPTY